MKWIQVKSNSIEKMNQNESKMTLIQVKSTQNQSKIILIEVKSNSI